MTSPDLHVIILAAGQGKRMYSSLPKVLHELAGKPLLHHVIDTSLEINPEKIHVVFGHGGEVVKSSCTNYDINWVHQPEQNGTGHAVDLALAQIPEGKKCLVLYGDVPLLKSQRLHDFIQKCNRIGILTAILGDPTGYGRILRQEGHISGIVEQRDASVAQAEIREINTGIMMAESNLLKSLLDNVDDNNDQGEIYLTDVVALAHAQEIEINSLVVHDVFEISGVNNKKQLAELERHHQYSQAIKLMENGVQLMDPTRIDIRGSLECGKDVVIDANCIFIGDVTIGNGVHIGPGNLIINSKLESGVEVKANCVIESAYIGESAIIGPFARLRPEASLGENTHIGNFVEIKKSTVGSGSKINHLSYIGDSEVGKNVNIGAGTITCNYDGANKHKTIIQDNVFIGSGNELVAPIIVGQGATTGAGSTLAKDVPEKQLTLARSKQRSLAGWRRPVKKKSD